MDFPMPTSITLKNVTDDIYARLREVAESHHRSINNEAIACLERVLLPSRVPASEHLTRARALRGSLKDRKFSANDIAKAIEQGRP
jgi:plasmid stability protein